MYKLELFNGTKTYVAPNGDLFTPEVMSMKYASINDFKYIITTDDDGEVCYAVELFSAVKNLHRIDPSLTDEQAIIKLEEILNTPRKEPEPTTEERIAAALEYQNLLSM